MHLYWTERTCVWWFPKNCGCGIQPVEWLQIFRPKEKPWDTGIPSFTCNLSRTLEPIPSHAMPFRLRKSPQKTILNHPFWGENIHRIRHFAFFCIPPTTTSFLTNVSDMTSSNKNTRSMPLFHTIFPMGLVQTACDHRVIILAGDQPHVQDSTCGPRHRTPRTANGLLFSELF